MPDALASPVSNDAVSATAHLWTRYLRERGIEERNALADAYGGFARMMAAKTYARRSGAGIEFDDYLQYARIGLLESIERFDPGRGARFETYAAIRIGGAILNGLESATELHEQLAAKRRMLAERTASLREADVDRPGDDDVFSRLADIAIGLAVGFMLEGSGMFHDAEEAVADNTYSSVELRQLRRHLHDTIELLPDGQRHVVHAHYVQHQAFEDIATVLGVSRSRVSQLHRAGLGALRDMLTRAAQVDFSC
jgi:RNA polymerase sigma factor for flagellar operon FliA